MTRRLVTHHGGARDDGLARRGDGPVGFGTLGIEGHGVSEKDDDDDDGLKSRGWRGW
jgi:hypothetical protein